MTEFLDVLDQSCKGAFQQNGRFFPGDVNFGAIKHPHGRSIIDEQHHLGYRLAPICYVERARRERHSDDRVSRGALVRKFPIYSL
jgi:hypothetical protein